MNTSHQVLLKKRLIKGQTRQAIGAIASCLTLFMAGFSSGCASSGTVTMNGGSGASHATAYNSVLIETSSEDPNGAPQQKLLHALVASGLQQSGKFKRVSGGSSANGLSADLKVVLKIVDLSRVSDAGRVFWGALAGRAGIAVEVEIIDTKSGATVKAFKAAGKSSAGWVGAGTTDQAVQKAAEQIVTQIVTQ